MVGWRSSGSNLVGDLILVDRMFDALVGLRDFGVFFRVDAVVRLVLSNRRAGSSGSKTYSVVEHTNIKNVFRMKVLQFSHKFDNILNRFE